MKKIIVPLLVALILTSFIFAGCDKNQQTDIRITKNEGTFSTEIWDIYTYNGYRCTSLEQVKLSSVGH